MLSKVNRFLLFIVGAADVVVVIVFVLMKHFNYNTFTLNMCVKVTHSYKFRVNQLFSLGIICFFFSFFLLIGFVKILRE